VFALNHKLMAAVTAHDKRQRQQAGRGRDWLAGMRAMRMPQAAATLRRSAGRTTPRAKAWVKLLARVGEEFPLECPNCGGDIRLNAFITEPGPIRKILTHLGEPLEPPPLSPARGPPAEWAELGQSHDYRDAMQASPDELPSIDIHSL